MAKAIQLVDKAAEMDPAKNLQEIIDKMKELQRLLNTVVNNPVIPSSAQEILIVAKNDGCIPMLHCLQSQRPPEKSTFEANASQLKESLERANRLVAP